MIESIDADKLGGIAEQILSQRRSKEKAKKDAEAVGTEGGGDSRARESEIQRADEEVIFFLSFFLFSIESNFTRVCQDKLPPCVQSIISFAGKFMKPCSCDSKI